MQKAPQKLAMLQNVPFIAHKEPPQMLYSTSPILPNKLNGRKGKRKSPFFVEKKEATNVYKRKPENHWKQ